VYRRWRTARRHRQNSPTGLAGKRLVLEKIVTPQLRFPFCRAKALRRISNDWHLVACRNRVEPGVIGQMAE
jgi:hypothetical protein